MIVVNCSSYFVIREIPSTVLSENEQKKNKFVEKKYECKYVCNVYLMTILMNKEQNERDNAISKAMETMTELHT